MKPSIKLSRQAETGYYVAPSISRSFRFALALSICVLAGLGVAVEFSADIQALFVLDQRNIPVVQTYLGLNIAVLLAAWSAAPNLPRSGWAGALSRGILFIGCYGLGILNLLLAGSVLLGQWDRLAVLVLIIPGAVLVRAGFAANKKTAPEQEPEVSAKSAGERAEPLENPARTFVSHLRGGVFNALYLALVVIAFSIGGFLFSVMRLIFFEDRVLPIESVWVGLLGQNWMLVGAYAVVVPAAVFVLVIAIGGVSALIQLAQRRNKSRFERQLTSAELDFLERATGSLVDYGESRTYPGYWGFLYAACSFVSIMALMIVCWWAAYEITAFLRPILATFDMGGAIWTSDIMGPGSVFALFTGIILAWPLGQWLVGRNHRFAEYAYLRQGWNRSNGQARTETTHYLDLEKDLRNDRISACSPFIPQDYIQTSFRRLVPLMQKITAGLAVLTFVLIFADARSYTAYTETGIHRVGYFSINERHWQYGSATGLQTACYRVRTDGRWKLHLRYEIHFADGSRFDLSDLLAAGTREQLIAIDSELESTGALHAEGRRRGVGQGDKPGLDPACLDMLHERFGADSYRIRALLRI